MVYLLTSVMFIESKIKNPGFGSRGLGLVKPNYSRNSMIFQVPSPQPLDFQISDH
jgi:hypothetical protein